jgi:hypothetical protein
MLWLYPINLPILSYKVASYVVGSYLIVTTLGGLIPGALNNQLLCSIRYGN